MEPNDGKKSGLLNRNILERENQELISKNADLEAICVELKANNEKVRDRNQQLEQKIEHISIVHPIGKMLISASDLGDVLDSIVQASIKITNAEAAAIMLLNPKTNELSLKAHRGFGAKNAKSLKIDIELSKAGEAIRKGMPITYESTGKPLKLDTGFSVNSALYVPLKGNVVGVLFVGNRTPGRPFSPANHDMLWMLADYAALAIDNANRAQILNSLHETGRAMLARTDLKEVLNLIAASAVEILGADLVILYEYNNEIKDFSLPPIYSGDIRYPEILATKSGTISHGDSILFKLLGRREPFFYALDADKDWTEVDKSRESKELKEISFIGRENVVSSAGLRLEAEGKPMGVAFFNYRTYQQFPKTEKRLIELFAHQAAIAIQNAKLHRDEKKRINLLANLVNTTYVVTKSTTQLKDVLQHIVDDARKIMGSDYALVFPYESTTRSFREDLITLSGVPEDIDIRIHAPRPGGSTDEVLKKGKLIVEDIANIKQYPFIDLSKSSFVARANVKSALGVRLRVGRQPIGVLYADYKTPRHFQQEEIQTLQLFGNHAAIAIQNANLFERERWLSKQADTLRDISMNVSSSIELGDVVDFVFDGLQRAVGYDRATLQFIDGDDRRLFGKRGLPDERISKKLLRPISQDALITHIVKTQDILILPHPKTFDLWVIEPETADIESWIGIPLVYGKQTIGLITLDHVLPGHYSENLRELLIPFASRVASAIENARLVKDYIDLAIDGSINTIPRHDLEDHIENIRHDFKEILNCVYVKNETTDNEEFRTLKARISSSIAQIQNAVKRVPPPSLDNDSVEVIVVRKWLEDYVTRIEESKYEYELALKFKHLDASDVFYFNSTWLSFVLKILLNNSRRAMASSITKVINITAQKRERVLEVEFADTGKGIPSNILPLLLSRRIEGTKGRGIGLMMAALILDIYGGNLSVKSTSTKGTIMLIQLPCHRL